MTTPEIETSFLDRSSSNVGLRTRRNRTAVWLAILLLLLTPWMTIFCFGWIRSVRYWSMGDEQRHSSGRNGWEESIVSLSTFDIRGEGDATSFPVSCLSIGAFMEINDSNRCKRIYSIERHPNTFIQIIRLTLTLLGTEPDQNLQRSRLIFAEKEEKRQLAREKEDEVFNWHLDVKRIERNFLVDHQTTRRRLVDLLATSCFGILTTRPEKHAPFSSTNRSSVLTMAHGRQWTREREENRLTSLINWSLHINSRVIASSFDRMKNERVETFYWLTNNVWDLSIYPHQHQGVRFPISVQLCSRRNRKSLQIGLFVSFPHPSKHKRRLLAQ